LKEYYEIKKTVDGALYDIAVRCKGEEDNEWLPVQVKTTKQHDGDVYNFKTRKEYPNCMILCLCISDKKTWIFNGNDVKVKGFNIGISGISSKYDINRIEESFEMEPSNELINIFEEYINNIVLQPFELLDVPVSFSQIQEQIFRKHREIKCNFLNFEYPIGTGLVYDFITNNKRVQEKVLTKDKIREYAYALFSKCTGKPYQKDDNAIYWFHFPCKIFFLAIPEEVLIQCGFIQTETEEGKTNFYVNLTKVKEKDHVYHKYLFSYDELKEKKINKLFI